MKRILVPIIIIAALTTGCCSSNTSSRGTDKNTAKNSAEVTYNVLTPQEKADGWQLLFDGKNMDQWRGFNNVDVSGGWTIKDDCLMSLGHGGDIGGDIVTFRDFENFELTLEWRIGAGGNSGILYGVIEDQNYKAVY